METVINVAYHKDMYASKTDIQKQFASKSAKGFSFFERIEKQIIWKLIRLKIFFYACLILRNPKKIITTYKAMLNLRSNVWGGDLKKIHKVDGRYYFNMYTPGWPSKEYDQLIKTELGRHASAVTSSEKLSFVFFAVTRKCPLRCEHCFEWDNLNQRESLTQEHLLKAVEIYQKEGALQFHFSGGEPMVRIKDLLPLISFTSAKSECWVLSSGFNVTQNNAALLKTAGCKGMVISIDHYIPEVHNLFRGHADSFKQATDAVKAAQYAGMVTAISVCATKGFIEGKHLLPYMEFAKKLGVQFVQVLEPRDLGRYDGKAVLLEERHINELEKIFTRINHSSAYAEYPTMLYHGFHQRRIGCFSGSRSIYIDSAGDVHACPFCHTKSYNVIELINAGENVIPQKENECPRFGKIA